MQLSDKTVKNYLATIPKLHIARRAQAAGVVSVRLTARPRRRVLSPMPETVGGEASDGRKRRDPKFVVRSSENLERWTSTLTRLACLVRDPAGAKYPVKC